MAVLAYVNSFATDKALFEQRRTAARGGIPNRVLGVQIVDAETQKVTVLKESETPAVPTPVKVKVKVPVLPK